MPPSPRHRTLRLLGRALEPQFHPVAFPSAQVVGYALSLGLTLLALWLAAVRHLAPVRLVPVLLGLALVQAGVQLASFMHVRESRGTAWHLPLLVIAAGVAVATIVFSMWIMTFKYGVS